MRILAAFFILAHGFAHLVGFLTPWGLLTAGSDVESPETPQTLFGGRLTLGAGVSKAFGVAWLALFVAFAISAVGVWREASWSRGAVVSAALASLVLCATWWPRARVGVYVNIVLILAVGALTYRTYRHELSAARARVADGSIMLATPCGPIEYAEEGAGTPVLVQHGTGGGWDQGIAGARALVRHGFRIIAPSRFGYLRTPLPTDASPAAEADTWACFLDALHLDRVPVISFSAGAAPSIQLALRHPERVSALVLVVPAAGGMLPPLRDPPPALVMQVALRYDLPMWAMLRYFPSATYNVAAVPAGYAATAPEIEVQRLHELMRMVLPVRQRYRGMINDAHSQSGTQPRYPIERIAAPTLLISAEDDLYRTIVVARHAAQIIPNARLIEFRTGGHFLLGHDAEAWPAVADFLRDKQPVVSTTMR